MKITLLQPKALGSCLVIALLSTGCSSRFMQQEPLSEARYPVEVDSPLGPEHGLRFDFTLLVQQLDILILEGAELCFPATVVQAHGRELRIKNEIGSGLLYDAANDIIIQRRLLSRLEKQLNYVNEHQVCELAKTEGMTSPGALAEKVSQLLNVDNQFAVGSSSLNPKYIIRLAQAVELIKDIPQYHLSITGHADDQGKDADNVILSRQRAEQVSRYIQVMGVEPSRIEISAVGSNEPLIAGSEMSVRLINRRVSIDVIDKTIRSAGEGDDHANNY
ncbi:OmpA family protein [Psychrobium sp. 1_MG-2023]|uniref:OmpA family protein n=1 Tax=Psychrobium sp. 1_MG-2023 TaxID=3062624 RepID=UPI000C341FFC|nr:OmpA family protein [Psychrobium sp. 1_MG-2023]MDP2561336.1 OmpA family protein [Psychrobium sp. 1_MG-2023]PKF54150.1 OmpA family protein [Alteromonadales bacterium alter-6D02]